MSGQENISLLQDFDEKLLMSHPSEICVYERLLKLDQDTKQSWSKYKNVQQDCPEKRDIHSHNSRPVTL